MTAPTLSDLYALPLAPDIRAQRWQETVRALALAVEREAAREGLTIEELAARWQRQAQTHTQIAAAAAQ